MSDQRVMREPTTISLTDTVIDRGQERPHLTSAFTGDTILSPASADPSGDFHRPKPIRSTSVDPRLAPPTIPPTHTNRTLVLCFDGTGDQFDADNSNIVQLVSLLKKDEKPKQMVYYQAGIGTYTSPQVATPLMSKVSQIIDAMFAWNLDAHVMGGYEFLMQNYIAGDKICIFGFSRGAYTARSLAGMIHKIGLLPADNFQQVPFAYKMYTRNDSIGWEQSNAFKRAFSVDVSIEFVGVWDTVDSVGFVPKRLPFTTSNTIVRTFRHAVSLDERRAKFKPNLWHSSISHEGGVQSSNPLVDVTSSPVLGAKDKKAEKDHKRSSKEEVQQIFEKVYSGAEERLTDVEEVWFSGCHCDIGGGSVSDATRNSLARIPLRWMVRECFKTNTGIMFDTEALRNIGLDPSTLYPFVTPRPPPLPIGDAIVEKLKPPSTLGRLLVQIRLKKKPFAQEIPSGSPAPLYANEKQAGIEEEEELKDALSPIYDQLRLSPAWWILEVLPLMVRAQLRPNLAQPRHIPDARRDGVKIHRTVKMRMEASYPKEHSKSKKYSPKIHIKVEPTWVG